MGVVDPSIVGQVKGVKVLNKRINLSKLRVFGIAAGWHSPVTSIGITLLIFIVLDRKPSAGAGRLRTLKIINIQIAGLAIVAVGRRRGGRPSDYRCNGGRSRWEPTVGRIEVEVFRLPSEVGRAESVKTHRGRVRLIIAVSYADDGSYNWSWAAAPDKLTIEAGRCAVEDQLRGDIGPVSTSPRCPWCSIRRLDCWRGRRGCSSLAASTVPSG